MKSCFDFVLPFNGFVMEIAYYQQTNLTTLVGAFHVKTYHEILF